LHLSVLGAATLLNIGYTTGWLALARIKQSYQPSSNTCWLRSAPV